MGSLSVGVLFGRNHILKTLLIVGLVVLFIWLGVWQLNRQEWRNNLNAEQAARLAQPPALINDLDNYDQLLDMVDQQVAVRGQFDYSEQIVLKNQNNDVVGPGVHLVAPFVLEGSDDAILVDRGWISTSEWQAGEYAQYDEALTELAGVVMLFQQPGRNAGAENSAETTSNELFRLVQEPMQARSSHELLPIVFRQTGDESNLTDRPWRESWAVELSPGNHLSYAVQWFSFALIFGIGYLFWLDRQNRDASN